MLPVFDADVIVDGDENDVRPPQTLIRMPGVDLVGTGRFLRRSSVSLAPSSGTFELRADVTVGSDAV